MTSKTLTNKRKKRTVPTQKAKTKSVQADNPDELETLEFLQAIDRFKRQKQKSFPSWSDVLEIIKSLGYKKTSD